MAPPPMRITEVNVLFERPDGVSARLATTAGEMDVHMTYRQYRSIRNQLADTGSAVLDSGADA